MARLAVNVDHIATVRQARGIDDPDPVLGAGFAELAGKVWRIGLMGFSSRREHVTLLLAALEQLLRNP